MNERYLVTGALGCVGAWAVRRLVREGLPVWTYDLGGDPYRLKMIMTDEELDQVRLIEGDIADLDEFERVVVECGITHILHLAAMQVPLVRADPVRGAEVNVVGSTVVFETAARHRDQIQNPSLCQARLECTAIQKRTLRGRSPTTLRCCLRLSTGCSSSATKARLRSIGGSSRCIALVCARA